MAFRCSLRRTLQKAARTVSLLLLLAAVLFALFTVYYERVLRYELEIFAQDEAENRFRISLGEAVLAALEEGGIRGEDLLTVDKAQDGKICAVRADMVTVSVLKSRLDAVMAKLLSDGKPITVRIPLGSLTRSALLYGRGFPVKVRLYPTGSGGTRMTGSFTSAGINQTLHRVAFEASASVRVVYPFHSTERRVASEIVIAETLLLGDVPNAYTEFNLEGDLAPQDLQGYVEDYGAH